MSSNFCVKFATQINFEKQLRQFQVANCDASSTVWDTVYIFVCRYVCMLCMCVHLSVCKCVCVCVHACMCAYVSVCAYVTHCEMVIPTVHLYTGNRVTVFI